MLRTEANNCLIFSAVSISRGKRIEVGRRERERGCLLCTTYSDSNEKKTIFFSFISLDRENMQRFKNQGKNSRLGKCFSFLSLQIGMKFPFNKIIIKKKL